MADLLSQLQPIAAIIGEEAVSANYSDSTLGNIADGYRPGWKVSVNAVHRGATLRFSNVAPTLEAAADATLKQLKEALSLK